MTLVKERAFPTTPQAPAEAAAKRFPGELALYVGLVAVGLALRLYQLDARALHHDESLHTLYSWYLYVGRGYVHDPMMHGPFQFHWIATIFFLFGDSDFTARLAPVLFGTALIALPYFLRHELGRTGALAASAILALSPSFLYFSRFARGDIYVAVWTMLMVVGLFGYLRTQDRRYLYLGATALALSFATKEVTYITGFIFSSFFVFALAVPSLRSQVVWLVRSIGLRTWLVGLAIFFGINVVLHTTFFTNPKGLCSMIFSYGPLCEGTRGALNYWIEQHGVQRGNQPWFYYLMLLPIYEFVPLLLSVVGAFLIRPRRLFFWFTLYWAVAAWLIYSQAGEKMPWLVLHLALPLVLLGSLCLGKIVSSLDLRRLVQAPSLWAAGLALFVLAAGVAWLALGAVSTLAPLHLQSIWLQRLLLSLAVAAAVGGLFVIGQRFGRAYLKPGLLLAAGLTLLAFYIRTATMVTYAHGDIPVEPLVYVQSSPDVVWVTREIERISFQTGQGKDLKILMDSGWGDGVHESVSWPFEWYLRHYRQRRYFSRTFPPDLNLADYPVTLAMGTNLEPIRPALTDYRGQKYRLNWWFPETYKTFDGSYKEGLVTLPGVRFDKLFHTLTDPTEQANLLKFLAYRDVHIAGAREFYFFVRNEVPALGPSFEVGQAPAPVTAARQGTLLAGPAGITFFGRGPAGQSLLLEPKDLAVDAQGRIHVVEARGHRVTVFNPDGSVSATWGRQGTGDGQFNEPWGIAVAPNGDVYVADTWNHRMQRFDSQGRFLGKWGAQADARRGPQQDTGRFWGPRDVAIGGDGTLYVTDAGNKRIQAFDPEGRFKVAFGGEGSAPGALNEPVGIAVSPDSTLLVADTWNGRVQRLALDARPIAQLTVEGWDNQSLTNKPYIAAHRDRVVISQPDRRQVLSLGADGRWQPVQELAAVSMELPTGVAFDGQGNLYVSDSKTGLIIRVPAAAGGS